MWDQLSFLRWTPFLQGETQSVKKVSLCICHNFAADDKYQIKQIYQKKKIASKSTKVLYVN